jgi:cytochrome b
MHEQKPKRYLGHNPAAAWMIVLLWGLVILLGISGWMMRIDFFWGDEWLQDVHAAIAYVLLAAVAVHITAALWMSCVHRENLVAAMWHGFKRAPDKSAADTGDDAR